MTMTYNDEGQKVRRTPAEHTVSECLGAIEPEADANSDASHDPEKLYARVNVQLSEESFRELVVNDTKGKVSEEEKQFLRSPSVLGRWNAVLGSLNRELQSQFAERRAEAQSYRNECMKAGPKAKQDWFDYRARYESWRGGATRFKGLIEERLAESKELIRLDKSRRRSGSKGRVPPDSRQAAGASEAGERRTGAANSLPLLSDVAELLSKEGAVREPFAAQRDWLLKRISETFQLVRGRSVSEEAACAASSGGACTQPDTGGQHTGENNEDRGGRDG